MAEAKLAVLKTRFSPGRILMEIQLVPIDGFEFDLPMEEAGNKLSQVANYARQTFGIRTAPRQAQIEAEKRMAEEHGTELRAKRDKAERKMRAMSKTLAGGSDRAIQVLEGELKRAITEGEKTEIDRARQQLDRAKAMKESQGK
jgi:hypothetical protein